MDANLKIVIDALNLASGELQKVKGQLGDVEQAGEKSGKGLGAAKDAFEQLTGVSLTGVGALMAVGGALKYSIDQAAEMQQIMAQTEAVIRSTGGAAGMTAQDVADLASALAQNSTFADDAIQKGENLLLTFTNIGADVFPMATQAMLDMATAMGTDASSGAIQLGKALNDPAEGVSALTRVGVTFTEEQKKLIKSLQETGDVAGAQKIILAELNKEFGGSAAAQVDTYAGQMKQLQKQIDDLAQAVGDALIPTLTEAAKALNLLLSGGNQVQAALKDHAATVFDTSESYDAYSAELKRAAASANMEVDAQGRLIQTLDYGTSVQTEVIDANYVRARSDWDATRATQARTAAENAAAIATRTQTTALQAAQTAAQNYGQDISAAWAAAEVWQSVLDKDNTLAVAAHQEALNAQLENLQTILGGPLKAEQDKYYEQQKNAGAAIADTQAAIDKLNKRQYLTSAQRQELDGLKAKLDEQKQTYADNAAAHEAATARIVFGLLQQKVLADGVQDGDIAFLAEMGKAWGLYDQQTADAMAAVERAVTEHGTNAQAVLTDLKNSALGLPNIDRYINYHVSTTGDPLPAAGDAGLGGDAPVIYAPTTDTVPISGAYAGGGDMWPGFPYLVGERGPELVIPRQAGTVLPAGETARVLRGGGGQAQAERPPVTVTVYATVASGLDVELLANRVARRIQAAGLAGI